MKAVRGAIFQLVSAGWSTASAIGRTLAERGLLKQEQIPSKVISVGNIQVGGAGKTPLVAHIAREAHAMGKTVCVLSRGYRANGEKSGGVLVPGKLAPCLVDFCGDEPALLRDLLPFAFIGFGADRRERYWEAVRLARRPIDVVIIDDGFQNWQFKKDIELVAVTSQPRSVVVYRDWASALRGADLVIWTKGDEKPFCAGRPMVKVRFFLPKTAPKAAANDEPLFLVAGVADPESVKEMALKAGYDVRKFFPFPDHAIYDVKSMEEIISGARSAGCKVGLTGKDWVKWRELGADKNNVTVLEPSMVFEGEGKKEWDRVLWGK
ncbi:MAG: tetraacyldisaccharide 4'-kinase [Bdellovibrionota bacterium]